MAAIVETSDELVPGEWYFYDTHWIAKVSFAPHSDRRQVYIDNHIHIPNRKYNGRSTYVNRSGFGEKVNIEDYINMLPEDHPDRDRSDPFIRSIIKQSLQEYAN